MQIFICKTFLQMGSVESERYVWYIKDMFKERECCTDKSAGGRRKGSGGRRDAVPPADTTYVLQRDTHTHTHRHSSLPVSVNWKLFGLCLFVCLSICHTVSLSDCQTVPNYSAFLEPENGRVCVCASFWVASIPAAAAAVASNLWFMFAPFFPLPPAAFCFAFCFAFFSLLAHFGFLARHSGRSSLWPGNVHVSHLCRPHSASFTLWRHVASQSTTQKYLRNNYWFTPAVSLSALPLPSPSHSTFSLFSLTVLQIVLHILCIFKQKFVFIFYQFTHSPPHSAPPINSWS